ncbi:hypothetical protein JD974_12265 [Chromobacterium haemolyticum]|uniref:Lipoprotein n=2 Tax=Chromobacterium haemolyticum TaxID=394935 RepID=A0ABS3GNG8_9NEIS|nr:hypothetical protein [Chromobacterium haemolyticum]MBK0415179.1 hypothetical protein [Chromobacterium haemolyticum]MBO0416606.1 hypothetical protein [Chromobacterium haemolyticum]MBO0499818.1 hypothetical protein [Chromobacterium haemolyticum]MDH0342826.1 hypothetical protein [Chromobacterium haemolyticum]BBH13363.1 hypothetical protein CH06BL_26110 [Chromobacterium haemolyticum]
MMNLRLLGLLLPLAITGCATGPNPVQMYPGAKKPYGEIALIQLDWITSLKEGSVNMMMDTVDNNKVAPTGMQSTIQTTVLPGRHVLGVDLVWTTGGVTGPGWLHTKKFKLNIDVSAGNLYAVCYYPSDRLAFKKIGKIEDFLVQKKWDELVAHPCRNIAN